MARDIDLTDQVDRQHRARRTRKVATGNHVTNPMASHIWPIIWPLKDNPGSQLANARTKALAIPDDTDSAAKAPSSRATRRRFSRRRFSRQVCASLCNPTPRWIALWTAIPEILRS